MEHKNSSSIRNLYGALDDFLQFPFDFSTSPGRWGLVLSFILVVSVGNITAQNNPPRSVSGVVTDANSGETLPGVNIVVSGSALGTVSDLDGSYAIQVPGEGSVLNFSFIGYLKQEVVVGNQTIVNISLESDAADLDEVVVVGYGTVKKRDLTDLLNGSRRLLSKIRP